jgi:hypothetical protein
LTLASTNRHNRASTPTQWPTNIPKSGIYTFAPTSIDLNRFVEGSRRPFTKSNTRMKAGTERKMSWVFRMHWLNNHDPTSTHAFELSFFRVVVDSLSWLMNRFLRGTMIQIFGKIITWFIKDGLVGEMKFGLIDQRMKEMRVSGEYYWSKWQFYWCWYE